MPARGNATGPVYGLGDITVATAGTPVPLDSNSPTNTGFGTSATPSPIVCNQIRVTAKSTNTGNFYLVFKGGSKATTESIALTAAPGATEVLSVPQYLNPFDISGFEADADTNANAANIVLVII